jgi:signal transduction histidine kinase
MPDRSLREEELLVRLGWFIKIRWLFLVGLGFSITFSKYILELSFPALQTIVVGGVILAYNGGFYLYHRFLRHRRRPVLKTSRIEASLQIGLDLLSLTALIHYTGSAENPFLFFYLFHAILAGMLLTRAEVWIVGFAAFSLFIGTLAAEWFGWIPHHSILGIVPRQNLLFISVVCLTFAITLFTTIHMVTSIVAGLRERELELVLTQKALIKKSEDLEAAHVELVEKQQQLVQTEKQASLGQLVAGIAHEINNPIQFIQGNMAIINEAVKDAFPLLDRHAAENPGFKIARLDYGFFKEQIPVLLKDMADGAVRIRDIVRDLKTFARRDEGKLDEDVDLNEVVRASIRLLHNQLKHHEVVEKLDPDLKKIKASMNQLQQVVVNSLLNAVQALRERPGGRIIVTTLPEGEGRQVRLSVGDNGPGIPNDIRDRIFDPFFTTKQRTGGTGLGLSIVYGIIERHHGQIEIDTSLDRGTTFHYLLPINRSLV